MSKKKDQQYYLKRARKLAYEITMCPKDAPQTFLRLKKKLKKAVENAKQLEQAEPVSDQQGLLSLSDR